MRKILSRIAVIFSAIVIAFGIMAAWYVIDTKADCRKYERENPSIEFNWSFETACEFQLSDGTWQGIFDYERQEKYEIEIEE